MEKMSKKQLEELEQSVGIAAEMGIMFFRAALDTGATMEETMKLLQAYLAALMFGQRSQPPQEDE